jgi:hypothetical protein
MKRKITNAEGIDGLYPPCSRIIGTGKAISRACDHLHSRIFVLKVDFEVSKGKNFFVTSEPVKNYHYMSRFRGHIDGTSLIRHVFLNQ